MVKALVIGVDSSTTACKAIAWDCRGTVVAEGRASHSLLHPEPTWHEQDAEEWWSSLCIALQDLLGQLDASRVEALCVTHQRESFVPVGREGRAIRNAILWIDERSRSQLAFLDEVFGADRLHQLTGKPPSVTQSLPKILWLAQNEPDVLARAHKILDVQGFLVHRLTGAFRTSLASADPMAIVDMEAGIWAGDLIRELGLRTSQFPDLVPSGQIIGQVGQVAGRATGLPEGLPVVAGAGDGQCAGLGANATGGGRAYLNLGTGVASGILTTDYLVDHAFRTLYAPIAGAYYLETVLRGGVFTVGWFVEQFASDLADTWLPLSPEEMLESAAAKLGPGASGLMLVPYWSGVMSPYWDPAASGITIGWGRAHGRVHLYRAILEGIAFEQRLAGDGVMGAVGQRFTEYVAMGGGSRSPLWCQILADVTGVPILRSGTTEATCLGAGILAATAAGWYPDARRAAEKMTHVTDRFTPDPKAQAVYEPLYREVYRPLFPAIRPLVDRLTELAGRPP
jgi:sugar (pentulose or hexulose) kinase